MNGKCDFHLNLDAGMKSDAFKEWAGCYIPGISPKETAELTLVRIENENDVVSLFELSLDEAVKNGMEKAICNLMLSSMKGFDIPKELVSVVQSLKDKYSAKNLELQFFLVLDTDNPDNFTDMAVAATFSLLGSGEFLGICFKGSEFLINPKKFERYIYSVQRHNQQIKIDFSLFSDLKHIDDSLIQKILPNAVSGNSLFDADYFLANKEFIADHNIFVDFTPDNFRRAGSELLNRLRMLRDFGVQVRLGSGNYLFHEVKLESFEF